MRDLIQNITSQSSSEDYKIQQDSHGIRQKSPRELDGCWDEDDAAEASLLLGQVLEVLRVLWGELFVVLPLFGTWTCKPGVVRMQPQQV